jgi:undecaprenyl pyrophosphate phosphatase UppP
MSNDAEERGARSNAEAPRLEPWLAVMLVAIVPMVAALVLPRDLVMHLAVVAGMFFTTGIVMLVVQERRKR